MYLWIFLGSYGLALVITLFMMAQRTKDEANELISRGASNDVIDAFYQEVGRRSRLALIQGAVITGTVIFALSSLVGWLATK